MLELSILIVFSFLAETMGFEPMHRVDLSHFECDLLNHLSTSPTRKIIAFRVNKSNKNMFTNTIDYFNYFIKNNLFI